MKEREEGGEKREKRGGKKERRVGSMVSSGCHVST